MKKFILACLGALVSASEGIVELTSAEGVSDTYAKNDFNVLSLYKGSSEKSKEVDALMDNAKLAFEKSLKDN